VPKRKERKTKDLWQFFLHALPMLQTPPPLIYKLMAGLDYGEELPWSRVVGEWITKWPRLLQWRTSSMDEKNDMVPNMVNFLLGDFYEGQAYLITSNPHTRNLASEDLQLEGIFIFYFSPSCPSYTGSSLPLIFCTHVRSGPIYWGCYLPCKKDYKVMVFYM
jgi:hypothetical protein